MILTNSTVRKYCFIVAFIGESFFLWMFLGTVQAQEPQQQDKWKLPPLQDVDENLSSFEKTFVEKFVFLGNRVLSEQELSEITAPYENRELRTEELEELRKKLTQTYIDQGYINSGVIFPQQEIEEGVIKVQCIEGYLSKVIVTGNRSLSEHYLTSRLRGGEVLNVLALQERLLLLKQNPRIQNLQAELSPGTDRGDSILKVQVREAQLAELKFKINNYSSPSVGEAYRLLEGSHLNLTGWGDRLDYLSGQTEGMLNNKITYKFPFTRWDTSLIWHNDRSESVVVSEPFEELEIRNHSETTGVALHHPFYRSPSQTFGMELKLERRTSQTWLLGKPFSFSPGVEEGKTNLSLVRFSQDWLYQTPKQVLSFRSRFSAGLDEWDATVHEDEEIPDGVFSAWRGQFQWVYHLGFWGSQLAFRGHLQYADQPLFSMEKFSLGGSSTVRGYQENQITKDNGGFSSLEWKIQVFDSLQMVPFADYGIGWDSPVSNMDSKETEEEISSVGLGLQWFFAESGYIKIFAAKAQEETQKEKQEPESLQEQGVHVEIAIQTRY